jgi:malonyl-CoA/methylmalonyl-CoA synthetase
VEGIKRNAMGKINKKELVPAVFGDGERIRRRSVDVASERAEAKRVAAEAAAAAGAEKGKAE